MPPLTAFLIRPCPPTEKTPAARPAPSPTYIAPVLFVVVLTIVVMRGCYESTSREDVINPDDPLPGAQTALPDSFTNVVPLLRAV